MDDWDAVSSPVEDTGATDPWDAVSTPQSKRPLKQVRQSVTLTISRRFVLLVLAGLLIAALASGIAFTVYRVSGIHTANSPATSTAQAPATATALQQIYTQSTSGTPTIDDPLSDNSNGWGVLSTPWGGSCAFTGGAYHIALSQPGYWVWCLCAGTSNLNNFALQVQMSVVQGNEGGILFGGAPNKGYRIYINSSGNYILYLQTNGPDQTLDSGLSPAIKAGLNQANVVTIIVNNSNFYLFVNQQFVTSDTLNAYTQGGVGFTAESVDQATDAGFNNAKVWTL